MKFSEDVLNALAESLSVHIGTAGEVWGQTGPAPATPDVAASGLRLFTLSCANPPLEAEAAGGTINFRAIASVIAENSGALGYLRVVKAGGVAIADIPASELVTPGAIAEGTTVSVSSLALKINQGA